MQYIAKTLAESDSPKPQIYLACGTEDMLIESSNSLHQYFDSLGLEHTYVTAPGAHNWAFWDPQIELAMDKYFGKN